MTMMQIGMMEIESFLYSCYILLDL